MLESMLKSAVTTKDADSMQIDEPIMTKQQLIESKKLEIDRLKLQLQDSLQAKTKRQELDQIAVSIQKLNKNKLRQELESLNKQINEKQQEMDKMDTIIAECELVKKRVLESLTGFSAEITKLKE